MLENVFNYVKCSNDNETIHKNNLALPDLTEQEKMKSVTADRTKKDNKRRKLDESDQEITRPDSPTQARNFRVYCEGCGKRYLSKKCLENHKKACRKLLNSMRVFRCLQCEQTFKKRRDLVKHSGKAHEVDIKSQSEGVSTIRSIFHSVSLLAVSDSPKVTSK